MEKRKKKYIESIRHRLNYQEWIVTPEVESKIRNLKYHDDIRHMKQIPLGEASNIK